MYVGRDKKILALSWVSHQPWHVCTHLLDTNSTDIRSITTTSRNLQTSYLRTDGVSCGNWKRRHSFPTCKLSRHKVAHSINYPEGAALHKLLDMIVHVRVEALCRGYFQMCAPWCSDLGRRVFFSLCGDLHAVAMTILMKLLIVLTVVCNQFPYDRLIWWGGRCVHSLLQTLTNKTEFNYLG